MYQNPNNKPFKVNCLTIKEIGDFFKTMDIPFIYGQTVHEERKIKTSFKSLRFESKRINFIIDFAPSVTEVDGIKTYTINNRTKNIVEEKHLFDEFENQDDIVESMISNITIMLKVGEDE